MRLSRLAMRRLRSKNRSRLTKVRQIQVVCAPEVMDVSDRALRAKTLGFLKAVEHSLAAGKSVRLCFRSTKKLHPCGTLVFVSHVEVWQARFPGRLGLRGLPDDLVVAQLFKHIGLLEQLGLSVDLDTSHEMVKDWYYISGEIVDAAAYRALAISARDAINHPLKDLFPGCLNEAVTNAVEHAYTIVSKRLPPAHVRKWWMFSQVRDGRLSVVIYDQGIGIPRSLMIKPKFSELLGDVILQRRGCDSRLIEVAADSARTGTLLAYRGKGLPEMLQFSKGLESGGLTILSAAGGFFYDSATQKSTKRQYDTYLPGTLVVWGIPLSNQSN